MCKRHGAPPTPRAGPFDEPPRAERLQRPHTPGYDDRLDHFRTQGAYRQLTAIIQAISQPFQAQAI